MCCLRMEAKQSLVKNIGQEEWIRIALICVKYSSGGKGEISVKYD